MNLGKVILMVTCTVKSMSDFMAETRTDGSIVKKSVKTVVIILLSVNIVNVYMHEHIVKNNIVH